LSTVGRQFYFLKALKERNTFYENSLIRILDFF
jgi:hypothetical protein